MNTKRICITGLFMALICFSTLFFKVPIPGGYAHLGNTFILLAALLLPKGHALVAAGFGSMLADLLGGWYIWIIPTLIIKGIMGFLIAFIAPSKFTLKSVRTAVASVLGIVEMVAGYFIAGIFTMDSVGASATQLPGLISEGIVGIAACCLISFALEAAKVTDTIQK